MSDSVPGESVPTCEICGANFANQDDLENHLDTHHNEMEASEADMKMHKCLDCGATFHSQDGLVEHQQMVHHKVEAQ